MHQCHHQKLCPWIQSDYTTSKFQGSTSTNNITQSPWLKDEIFTKQNILSTPSKSLCTHDCKVREMINNYFSNYCLPSHSYKSCLKWSLYTEIEKHGTTKDLANLPKETGKNRSRWEEEAFLHGSKCRIILKEMQLVL